MESQLLNLLGVEDYHRVTIHYFFLFFSQVSFAVTLILYIRKLRLREVVAGPGALSQYVTALRL